jgi:hypothetical protein
MERTEREVLRTVDQVAAKLRGLMGEDREVVRNRFRVALWRCSARGELEGLREFVRDLIHPDSPSIRRRESAQIMSRDPGHFATYLRKAITHADAASLSRLSLSYPELVSHLSADYRSLIAQMTLRRTDSAEAQDRVGDCAPTEGMSSV